MFDLVASLAHTRKVVTGVILPIMVLVVQKHTLRAQVNPTLGALSLLLAIYIHQIPLPVLLIMAIPLVHASGTNAGDTSPPNRLASAAISTGDRLAKLCALFTELRSIALGLKHTPTGQALPLFPLSVLFHCHV